MIARRTLLTQAAAFGFAAIGATAVFADNSGKKIPLGQIKRHGNGAPKGIPPGQAKKWARGDVVPVDLRYDEIIDLSDWKLRPPGKGNTYIKVDNEVYEVVKDTGTVIEAIGIVSDLLN